MKTGRVAAAGLSLIAAGCATVGGPDATPQKQTRDQGAPSGKPAFRAADLAGKETSALDALLGAPDLARIEGDGEFRRYDLAECALIIILYPDDSGVKRAVRLDAGALTSGEEKPDLDRCLALGRAKSS